MQTGVLVLHGLSYIQFAMRTARYEQGAYVRIEKLQSGDEFAGAAIVHHSFCDNQMDRPWELVTDAPGVTPAGGFQHRVAEAAKNQGLRHESGGIIFDQKNRLDGHAVLPGNILRRMATGPRGEVI